MANVLKGETAMPESTEAEALREFLLDLLISAPNVLLSTPEGRDAVAVDYERQAHSAHPAVAIVLRVAAAKIRGE